MPKKPEVYDLDWLKEKANKEERVNYLFFWGHKKHRDGTITSNCFSQWGECEFEHEGDMFRSAEHWMMYQKAALFNDEPMASMILECESPGAARKLGRKVQGFDEKIWNTTRMEVVVEGNLHKFSQNENIKKYLQQTGNRVLVEANPVDKIWGVGLTKDSIEINDPQKWRGLNLLGFALMEVRNILRSR